METEDIIAYPLISIHIYMHTHKYAWISIGTMTGFIQWIRVDAYATSERSYPVAEMCDKVVGVRFCEYRRCRKKSWYSAIRIERGKTSFIMRSTFN